MLNLPAGSPDYKSRSRARVRATPTLSAAAPHS